MPPAHTAAATAKQKLLLLAPVPFRSDLLSRKLWRQRRRQARRAAADRELLLLQQPSCTQLADLLPPPNSPAVRRACKLLRRLLLSATEASGSMTQRSRLRTLTEQFSAPVLMSAVLRRAAKATASSLQPPSTRKRSSASKTRSSASNQDSGSQPLIMHVTPAVRS